MKKDSPYFYEHGSIGWTELSVADPARARSFYTELLGWKFDSRGDVALAIVENERVAAIRRTGDPSAHPMWMPFVAVDDVEKRSALARRNGASPSTDNPSLPEGAQSFDDPEGARFVLWDGRAIDGMAHRLNRRGGFSWNELWAVDVPRLTAFYQSMIGWDRGQQPGPGGAPYALLTRHGDPKRTHAGVRSTTDGAAHWMAYFEVDDCHVSIERAASLGGKITQAPVRVPGVGFVATFVDLEGAYVGLVQGDPP